MAFNINIESDLNLDLPKSTGNIDLRVFSAQFQLPKMSKTKINRADTQANYAYKDGFHFLEWPNLVAFKINENNIWYKAENEIPEGLLRIFILSEAIGIVLFLRGKYLLHGSAVKINENAEVFLGTPGAGKSTTIAAFYKNNFTVLSDDLVAIKINLDKQFEVIPSFPEIKIWEDTAVNLGFDKNELVPAWEGKNKYRIKQKSMHFGNEKLLLKKINILQKPYAKHRPELSIIEMPIELLKYFPLPHQLLNGENLKRHFEQSLLIAQQTENQILNRPKNFLELDKFINTYQ